jgi:hypothetical protein
MDFPERIFTSSEVEEARRLAESGYKHNIQIQGSATFVRKTNEAMAIIKTAGYFSFFSTYIKHIKEIDGFTQLRKTEATIWANAYAVENAIDAASIFIQKANQMKEYLDCKLYYGGEAEKRSMIKRIEFIKILKQKSPNKKIREECEQLIQLWKESSLVY